MNKHIRFAYDKESDQYMLMKSVSPQINDTDTISIPLCRLDKNLADNIKKLADYTEKTLKLKLEQMRFLLIHRYDSVGPNISNSNEEYLSSIEKHIKDAEEKMIVQRQDIVAGLEKAKDISVDSTSLFLLSFLSDNYLSIMRFLDFDDVNNWNLENLGFEKNIYIIENLNALCFQQNDVKILLTETNNRETVKIVESRDVWESIANDAEYREMLTNKETEVNVYSLTSDRFAEIEKGLKASTSAKNFLDEKLGEPLAIKRKGERAKSKE